MRLGKREPLNISHHCAKFGAYRLYAIGDETFLIFLIISLKTPPDQDWYDFVGGGEGGGGG